MKLTPTATAAANMIAQGEMDAMIRKASMVLPVKQATRELGQKLAQDLDAALGEAIERHLGEPLTDPETIRGRLIVMHDNDPDTPPQERGDFYYLDTVPILWAGPAKVENDGSTMKASRSLRAL